MNTNTFINVHEFDGKLSYTPLENGAKILSVDDKIILIQEFREDLTQYCAISAINLILYTLSKDDSSDNYDPDNKINSADLLVDILILAREKELLSIDNLIPLIEEQLSDIFLLGQCPQGRSTRLLQIWNILNI